MTLSFITPQRKFPNVPSKGTDSQQGERLRTRRSRSGIPRPSKVCPRTRPSLIFPSCTDRCRRGEQAATALEANLTHLESKLDAMLAALEKKASGAEGKVQGDGESGK
ncbi:hypothetical protein J3458_004636 [Metarhizium acridum]|uniref:uncharacterized protein n=1 Tax=Metarhizium acridum TaxID=92637 RepID=UPI001C6CF64A|nr:hypothetical protein J3458_004636 [Metarhizium acridum]